ncbi:MAG: hypothetical protein PWQ60_2010 [Thermoanaerobacteraceae bacterium]|jgi:hypothetical protein|nr:hypothetical protein [Thermoanaerobacteraceae bacterium]
MSENIDKQQYVKHCEEIIKSIKDIVSAKIITSPEGKISEIHVIASSKRNPKQIVRDIESALIATLGSEIDHKKISVAQISHENEYMFDARLKIDGIGVKNYRFNYEASVTLSDRDGNTYEGKAEGPTSIHGRLRTAAVATVNAIQQFLGDAFVLSLEDVVGFKIGGKEALGVLVSLIIEGSEEQHFLGSALVKQDKVEATVAAVLNAVNRKISFMVKENTV